MREQWLRTGDNRVAVTSGLAVTGRVITAAGTIMILVFLSFLLVDNITIRQFGVGLAVAIIVDAFVVRTVLVPALMHLFGRANWWLPGWLDRRLPHLAVDVCDARSVDRETGAAIALSVGAMNVVKDGARAKVGSRDDRRR
jgi:putative drug exporter of the RND superfamily